MTKINSYEESFLVHYISVFLHLIFCVFEMAVKIPSDDPSDMENLNAGGTESGYASGSSSADSLPEVIFTKPHLQFLNRQLQSMEPQGAVSPFATEMISISL